MNEGREVRRNWRIGWLGSIQDFADQETQRGAWLNPENSNPHFSYVECMACYFDVAGLSYGYKSAIEEGFVTIEEAAAVADFHAVADTYEPPNGDDYAHEAILADPKWSEVVAAAKQAQTRLLALISDPSERQSLSERSPHALAAVQKG